MCARTKLYNLIKTLKNLRLGRAPSDHQYVLWYYMDPFLATYPNSTINSKISKYFFLVPQFLGFIPQSSIIRTQTVINIQLCPCWKVQVSSIKIFQIFFNTHPVLTIFSPGKFHIGLVTIFTQSMAVFYFVPRNFTTVWCWILQTVGSSWSCLTEEGMHTTSTYSPRTVDFSSTVVLLNSVLNQSIIHLLH